MSVKLLGVEFEALSEATLTGRVAEAIASNERHIIANHNLRSVYLFHRDGEMRRFYAAASTVHIDGMPLIAWAKALGYKVYRSQRVTYVDWILPLLLKAELAGWRVFYLGGAPGVADRASTELRLRFPKLNLATHHGYFADGSEQHFAVHAALTSFRPNILMIGMGMPTQERWIMRNLEALPKCVILNSGACFDYIAGAQYTPPRWAGQFGIEWLFRLVRSPRRLARRYLVEPWALIPLMLRDLRERLRGRIP